MTERPDPTDLLTRAEAALRDAPAPIGPSDATLARSLAALAAAEVRPNQPREKRQTMWRIMQLAAAIVVAAGGVLYLGYALSGSSVAFADVAKKIQEAETFTCQVTMKTPDLNEPMTMRYLARGTGQMRFERAAGVTVMDTRLMKILAADPRTKTAILMEFKKDGKGPETGPVNLVEELRKLADKDGKPVGKKKVGDVEAQGFRVTEGGQEFTVWADPKTKLPLVIEGKSRFGGQDMEFTMTDFQLNPKLDDSLFRLDAPEGYKLIKFEAEDLKPEEDVTRILRAYAAKKDGQFPKRLDDWKELGTVFGADPKANPLDDPDVMKFAMSMGRVAAYSMSLEGFGYKGDGVKLGDADKIVFWYKPKEADKYRVLYGDLKTGDVTADRLPERPKERPQKK
jgi:outer membrane lipoprotein-sorting protein